MTWLTACTTCAQPLLRCVVYPCRNIVYDYNDPLRAAHLAGICSKCNVVAVIYYADDTRVYFPPSPIQRLDRLPDRNYDGPLVTGQLF